MAAFTSVTTGDWNDGATWGNSSPGSKGTDWPGAVGDTVTISNGDVVTYNVDESNALSDLLIEAGGELIFATNQDTLLTLDNAGDLTLNGTLKVGTVASPVDAAYTAVIDIQATDSGDKIDAGANSEFHVCGDPDYFGSKHKAIMYSNWTTGQTFTITGDYTSDWNVGDELVVIKDGEYSAVGTDTVVVSIASIAANGGNTDITINESFPGTQISALSDVFHVTRNVKIGFNGTLDGVQINTSDSSSGGLELNAGGLSYLSACQLGWLYALWIHKAEIDYVVFHNTYVLGRQYYGCKITNMIEVSCGGSAAYHNCHGGDLSTIGSSQSSFQDCILESVRIINCSGGAVLADSLSSILSVEIYKCNTGFNTPLNVNHNGVVITGHFGENANGLSYWTNDPIIFWSNGGNNRRMYIKDFHTPASSLANMVTICTAGYYNNGGYALMNEHIFVEAWDGDRTDPRYMSKYGYGSMVTADGSGSEPSQRSGGNASVWKIVTASNCDGRIKMLLAPVKMRHYTAGSESITFRLYFQTDYVGGVDYVISALHNGGLEYSTGTIATRSSQSDWSEYAEISTTFANDGFIEITCGFWGYESGKYIWIDPVFDIS